MPVAEHRQVCRLDAVPRGDRLIHWDRDATDPAAVLHSVAVVESNAKAINLYDV
jgi:hypothetical protein